MAKTKVIVAGAGIAGPVLAMFLKGKGYDPIIYERTDRATVQGLRLTLQPNGLKVLSLVPGLLDKVVGRELQDIAYYSVLPEDPGLLLHRDGLSHLRATFGFATLGVHRPTFHRTLLEHVEASGIPVVFGHQLVSVEDTADAVKVTFANGTSDSASFVVGCDGLHSSTRECLFGKQQPTFTGLVQTAGLSKTPEELLGRGTMLNIYGDGLHFIAYPVNDRETAWGVITQEPEAKENWRAMDEEEREKFRHGEYSRSQWPCGASQMISTADTIIKYGLYDRPELRSWHKGRVVLLGDAAHPTSPHLGQGANQAFEDIYHLIRILTKYNPDAAEPTTEVLSKAFTEYEDLRIARTTGLVERARKQGEVQVVHGVEEAKKRNNIIRALNQVDVSEVSRSYNDIIAHPFEIGHSEVSLSA